MLSKIADTVTGVYKRYRLLAVALVVVLSGISLYGMLYETETLQQFEEGHAPEIEDALTEARGPLLPAAAPVRISIPALAINASFEDPLGLNEQSEIEVPEGYDTVSYYQHGPTPGELGPAVVLGHVDSKDGPAVFFSLGQLVVGDEIEIERADGTRALFVVTRLERHEQAGFPSELVYGNIDHAGLRLITCSGDFDRQEERYSHNLIVFAELKA